MPKVLNKHRDFIPSSAIYIGRPSKWGNPFAIKNYHNSQSRKLVIEKFEEWIVNQPLLIEDLKELSGKDLVCFCSPKECHGDILLRMANENTKS